MRLVDRLKPFHGVDRVLRNGFRSVTKALYNAGLQTARNVLNVKTISVTFSRFSVLSLSGLDSQNGGFSIYK